MTQEYFLLNIYYNVKIRLLILFYFSGDNNLYDSLFPLAPIDTAEATPNKYPRKEEKGYDAVKTMVWSVISLHIGDNCLENILNILITVRM